MIDPHCIRRRFNRIARDFAAEDFLHDEIRGRLLDRLTAIKIEPRRILDLGAGTGAATPLLSARYDTADIVSLDSSAGMLAQGPDTQQRICADAMAMPLKNASTDLIVSNLMLHHCPDPVTVLSEARRVLTDNGVLLLTTLGRSSLLELGRAWATADNYSHIAPCFDIQELGNLLAASGFTEPVLDSQTLTITYDNLDRLMRDLRTAGSTNATPDRNRGLTARATWQRLAAAYAQLRNQDGKLPVTIEVLFCITWAGSRPRTGGEIEVSVNDLLGTRRKPSG